MGPIPESMNKSLYFNSISRLFLYTLKLESTGVTYLAETKKTLYSLQAHLEYTPGTLVMDPCQVPYTLLCTLFILSPFILPTIL